MYVKFLKQTLGLARCGNVDFLFLPTHAGGLGLPDITHLYKECQVQRCLILKHSTDFLIRDIYNRKEPSELLLTRKWSALKTVIELWEQYQQQLPQVRSRKKDRDNIVLLLKNKLVLEHKVSLNKLEMQSKLVKVVQESPNMNTDSGWISLLIDLPPSVIKFAANATLNTLPTPDNLRRWKIERKMPNQKKVISDICLLCDEGPCCYCKFILDNEVFNRPKWRHDTVLSTLIKYTFHNLDNVEFYCDLYGHENYYVHLPFSSSNLRPDLVTIKEKNVLICELSCPMEDYIDVRHSEKTSKYQPLIIELISQGFNPSIFAFEVGALGAVSKGTFDLLAELGVNSVQSKQIADELTKAALLCSYKIYLNRDNKVWRILE
ncbi:hypothetical protein RCL1_003245 [Eukaryota sp. TZLM3-RCL]